MAAPRVLNIEERRRSFQCSAEFYDSKALHWFATFAIAVLDNLGGRLGALAPDEAQMRVKNAREALDVFAKVGESLVYVNMGHFHYASDEYHMMTELSRV